MPMAATVSPAMPLRDFSVVMMWFYCAPGARSEKIRLHYRLPAGRLPIYSTPPRC
jgi:hypothetical protein